MEIRLKIIFFFFFSIFYYKGPTIFVVLRPMELGELTWIHRGSIMDTHGALDLAITGSVNMCQLSVDLLVWTEGLMRLSQHILRP